MARSPRNTLVQLLALAVLLLACQRPADRSPASTRWQLDPQPSLTVTSDRLPEGHELNGIYSALELPDGSLLIANSGAGELLLVDSTGQYQRTIGRRGQGPGEYADNLHLFQGQADTVVVYDGAGLRWTFLTPSVELARTEVEFNADIPSPTWLTQGAMVTDAVIRQGRSHARQVIGRLRSQDPDYRHPFLVKQDAQGTVWVRQLDNAQEWDVYPASGSTGARVTLPPDFDLIAIERNAVIGITRDSLGEEMVQVHPLARPPETIGRAAIIEADQPAPTPPDERPPLARELVKLVIVQESYYADHAHYADVADSLDGEVQGGGRFFLLHGDDRSWWGVAVMPNNGLTCGMAVGFPTPPSWHEGAPVCSEE